MPRQPTPTALLELTGQAKHNKKRHAHRATEPKPNKPLGSAPKHFTPAQRKLWKELASIAPADVLADADRWIVEAAVLLMERVRTGSFTASEIANLRACLASCGMSPADRSRVSSPTGGSPNIEDPLSDLIQ